MSFAEIHFHLLPGLDDGPPSIEASVELARAAAAEGTRTIVATPHVHRFYPIDVSSLPERVRHVAGRLRAERIPVEVLCGGELAPEMVARLTQPELELIAQGPPDNRWLLLEAPFSGLDDAFAAAADELRVRGFGVVVAHPERSLRNLQSDWRVLEHELRAGSAIQLTAWSLAGLYGERARAYALRLLHAAPLVAVASDAHGPERMPSLRLARDAPRGWASATHDASSRRSRARCSRQGCRRDRPRSLHESRECHAARGSRAWRRTPIQAPPAGRWHTPRR
jgi:protein-tyrosine phosphatase